MRLSLQNSDYIINSASNIKDTMEKITANHRGCVVVVNEDMLVVGVLSDGDIRRAMVRGASILTPVEKVMNQNFVAILEDTKKESVDEIFSKYPNINVIPKIDKDNKLTDFVIRGGAYKG